VVLLFSVGHKQGTGDSVLPSQYMVAIALESIPQAIVAYKPSNLSKEERWIDDSCW